VIATAGTPAKRELLRLLGADHVFDSRGLEFADLVAGVTGGEGVDVVLNSLAGEAIPRSLELLRAGGRFVELGKRDIYGATPLMLRPFRNNLAYFAVDAHQLLTHAVPAAASLFAEIAAAIGSGAYRPLPHQVYPVARADEAFQAMRRSRHIGKVVLSFDTPPPAEPRPLPDLWRPGAGAPGRPGGPGCGGSDGTDGTVLITGGLAGFGAATAVHLARRGVRRLALAGRRGAGTPGAAALVDELARLGAEAVVYQTDVTDQEQVTALLRAIEATGHPLRGVVHGSMVLDDGPLPELTESRLRAVLAPKLLGGLLLDRATRGLGLDFFVVYSSGAGVIGNVQQASYVGSNLFLEALIRDRRAGGDHGLALAYGPISDEGYVAREGLVDTMRQRGWLPVTAAEAFTAFDELLDGDAAMVVVDRTDWGTVRWMLPAVDAPRFTAVLPSDDAGDGAGDPESLRLRLRDATPEEAHAAVCEALADVVSTVLHYPKGSLDPSRPMDQLGVDSLMATELSQAVRRRFGCEFSPMEITNGGGIDSLARRILQRLGHQAAAPTG
jgi:NAD(P)-dependent dehydrogenase (short-subunit alcohol dehydrogenase family)/acyl carrier protein